MSVSFGSKSECSQSGPAGLPGRALCRITGDPCAAPPSVRADAPQPAIRPTALLVSSQSQPDQTQISIQILIVSLFRHLTVYYSIVLLIFQQIVWLLYDLYFSHWLHVLVIQFVYLNPKSLNRFLFIHNFKQRVVYP